VIADAEEKRQRTERFDLVAFDVKPGRIQIVGDVAFGWSARKSSSKS